MPPPPSTGRSCPRCTCHVFAGKFGSTTGLTSALCSGDCSAGFTCPAGSTTSAVTQCPAGQWSGVGAVTCSACDPGRFGSIAGLSSSSCSGGCLCVCVCVCVCEGAECVGNWATHPHPIRRMGRSLCACVRAHSCECGWLHQVRAMLDALARAAPLSAHAPAPAVRDTPAPRVPQTARRSCAGRASTAWLTRAPALTAPLGCTERPRALWRPPAPPPVWRVATAAPPV
jgi:hypothetical protein